MPTVVLRSLVLNLENDDQHDHVSVEKFRVWNFGEFGRPCRFHRYRDSSPGKMYLYRVYQQVERNLTALVRFLSRDFSYCYLEIKTVFSPIHCMPIHS